jgi:hypothetical protein
MEDFAYSRTLVLEIEEIKNIFSTVEVSKKTSSVVSTNI